MRAVSILFLAVLAGVSSPAALAQHTRDTTTKTTTQPPPQPTTTVGSSSTGTPAVVKVTTVSHDVCAKHPNLKQCS